MDSGPGGMHNENNSDVALTRRMPESAARQLAQKSLCGTMTGLEQNTCGRTETLAAIATAAWSSSASVTPIFPDLACGEDVILLALDALGDSHADA